MSTSGIRKLEFRSHASRAFFSLSRLIIDWFAVYSRQNDNIDIACLFICLLGDHAINVNNTYDIRYTLLCVAMSIIYTLFVSIIIIANSMVLNIVFGVFSKKWMCKYDGRMMEWVVRRIMATRENFRCGNSSAVPVKYHRMLASKIPQPQILIFFIFNNIISVFGVIFYLWEWKTRL